MFVVACHSGAATLYLDRRLKWSRNPVHIKRFRDRDEAEKASRRVFVAAGDTVVILPA